MSKIFKGIKDFAIKRGPELCIAAGIAGMVGSIIFTVKATVKAKAVVEETKKELEVEDIPKTEIVKMTWKYYIPTAASFVASAALIILADHKHNKRNAALGVAYAGLETTLNATKEKIFETVGEKKAQQITDAVAKDKMEKNPVSNNEIIVTGKGKTRIYDAISGRYFKSTIEELRSILNDLNKDLLNYDYVSLNEFYDRARLPRIKLGDDLGWNMRNGYIEMTFSAQISEDDEPCIVLDYLVAPRYDYRDLY